MMTTWKSIGMVLPAVLAGCIIPLDVDVDGDHHRDSGTIEGSGYLVSETRVVADFDAVVASGTGRVIIQRTGRETLRITAAALAPRCSRLSLLRRSSTYNPGSSKSSRAPPAPTMRAVSRPPRWSVLL